MRNEESENRNRSGAEGGAFLGNVVRFGRLLRGLGLPIGPARLTAASEVLLAIDIGQRADVYYALRALLVSDPAHLAIFDVAFERFWREPQEDLPESLSRPDTHTSAALADDGLHAGDAQNAKPTHTPAEAGAEGEGVRAAYSAVERLRHVDLATLTPAERRLVQQLLAEMVRRRAVLGPGRRRMAARRGAVDPRRTLRDAMGHGGEIVAFSRRSRKPKPRPLLLLADISGSMAGYTELLLHLLYGLAQWPGRRVEVFLFGTRLTRITPLLRTLPGDEALRRVTARASDWSGGTRTGAALRTLRRRYGGQALCGRPESVVISDGWDRGDPRLLRDEMAHLRRASRRLIWLTPLLRDPAYEPLTQGMQAALPFIDELRPMHTLAALKAVVETVAADERREIRKKKTETAPVQRRDRL